MKIGVLTVYDVSNYGSFLQAVALKNELEAMGHEVYHIKVKSEKETRQGFYKYPATRRSLHHPIEEVKKYLLGRQKYQIFQKASEIFKTIEYKDCNKMDLIIVGSDEIWNVSEKEFQNPMYFCKNIKCRKATYGISVGKGRKKDFDQYPEYKKYIKKMDYITARDENTQKLVQEITGKRPPMVCDPTFLVPVKTLTEPLKDEFLKKEKYLLVYTYYFTIDPWLTEYIVRYAREKNLKIVSAGFYFSWCDYTVNCSPKQFNQVLKNAECIVTTTFHGSVMSFLNHKELLAVPFSPKVNDVMNKVSLGHLVVNGKIPYKKFKEKMEHLDADWNLVDERIAQMREDSKKILKEITACK